MKEQTKKKILLQTLVILLCSRLNIFSSFSLSPQLIPSNGYFRLFMLFAIAIKKLCPNLKAFASGFHLQGPKVISCLISPCSLFRVIMATPNVVMVQPQTMRVTTVQMSPNWSSGMCDCCEDMAICKSKPLHCVISKSLGRTFLFHLWR